MTTPTTHSTARDPDIPRRGSRRLVLTGAVLVALVSTGSAYLAMVQFGIDVLGMTDPVAYTTAGVFELSLVTVALMARAAAQENRPGGTLLTLTWVLSSASGVFAAWHELYIGHPLGAALFRFLVPLLAALMWHLALIGDRHLATGRTWSSLRQTARMHALFLSTEDLFRAQSLYDGSRAAQRRLARADAARRRARAIALRTVPPEEMRYQVDAWLGALRALGDGDADVARLHAEDRTRMSQILTVTPTSTPPHDAIAAPAADTRQLVDHAAADTGGDISRDTRGDTGGDIAADSGRDEATDADATSTGDSDSGAAVSELRRDTSAGSATVRRPRHQVAAATAAPPKTVNAQVRPGKQERLARVSQLRDSGLDAETIAEEIGIGVRTIYRDFKELDDASADTTTADSASDTRRDTTPGDSSGDTATSDPVTSAADVTTKEAVSASA